jgi:hypothetical protein
MEMSMRTVSSTIRQLPGRAVIGLGILVLFLSSSNTYPQSYPGYFDTIGLTVLRATTTNLNGAGIPVAQIEAQATDNDDWEVNPADSGINLPVSNFTWYNTNATATIFPNTLGIESGHGDEVGSDFYGLPDGVSTNVLHIDNFEADDFLNNRIEMTNVNIGDRVASQSFDAPESEQVVIDNLYDNYSALNKTLFITGVGDGGQVVPPATCYNGIGVSAYYNTNASSTGPTSDGRAKPDLTAPLSPTSFSTPLVSGAAAILQEAGTRGDGGTNTNAATDPRTLKALLMNGAIKPATWSNPSPSQLDPVYGSGILDVFESYHQLVGGKHGYIATTNVIYNNPHPPTGATGNISSLVGWDFNWITNTLATDAINHYCFEVTNSAGTSPFTGTMTLVWNRHYNTPTINNLSLYLYNMANGNLMASSTSSVDNIQHIYVPSLPAGRYDLEVLKHGGTITSTTENYALAFEFFAIQVAITPSTNGLLMVTWPAYPDAFQLQVTYSLASPISWIGVASTLNPTNGQYFVFLNPVVESAQYFRLYRYP